MVRDLPSLVANTTDKNCFHVLMNGTASLRLEFVLGANVLVALVIGNDKAPTVWHFLCGNVALDDFFVTSLSDGFENRVIY